MNGVCCSWSAQRRLVWLIPSMTWKKGSTGPWNLRVVLELGGCSCLEEFWNCVLGLLATSSRHARLSAACLVGATSDNNLNDRSNSMSIKTEIIILRLSEEMIFSLCARSRANRVGFYTIPYIRAHILALALLTPESVKFWCQKESHHVLDHFIRDGGWMKYYCTNSYPAIFFHDSIACGWMKYWICESAGWGGESVNLLHQVDIVWMSTSHV